MRRSSSQSCIPLRLFGPSTSASNRGRRDSSKSRASGQDGLSSNRPTRATSLDRKSYTNMKTPLTRQKSFQRTTPISARPQSSDRKSHAVKQTPRQNFQTATPSSIRSNSTCKSSKSVSTLKERKTIQKLSTNKDWVHAQYQKVKYYISTSTNIDPTILKPENIRPPSIKGFIYLVSVLFGELFPSPVNMSMENYKEVIAKKLKAMHYPGSMTNSVLKTVNTMHSWPQVIGMFGWLIDKVNLVHNGQIDMSKLTPVEKQECILTKLCRDYILERYQKFNDTKDTTEDEEQRENFISAFANNIGVDINSYEQLKNQVEEKERNLNSLIIEVQELKVVKENLEERKASLQENLDRLQETDAAEDAELDVGIKHYTKILNELIQQENDLNANIHRLEESIKKQPCTYQEKKNLMHNIKTLKNELNIIKEKVKHDQDIKHTFDTEIQEEHEKLQSKIIEWNRSLRTVCIKKPEFRVLLFKEIGLHRTELLDEIKEIAKIKSEMEKNMVKQIESMEINLKQCNDDINNMTKELSVVQGEIESLIQTINELNERTAIIEKETQMQLEKWEHDKQTLLSHLRNSDEQRELEMTEENNEQLSQKQKELVDSLEKFKVMAVDFFLQIYRQVNRHMGELKKIVEKVKNQVEAAAKKELEEREQLNEFLESLQENN
ncbi:kinetochore protein NDC80 homolog [Diabrotica virgifera virgifera]|uniref:Kinetochore protein NDC80 n=1 Tax=Diabrotica virgifera virgifera TaxID=50390 RepID=A0A6P7FYD6_DIAVI|nr:kinetochore protein NDC80 homolog [Diabrotica virgifera virgifera]XP_028141594.1 kinetochore protein NDC80 homolog [Diabrotica virgifera virgifera]